MHPYTFGFNLEGISNVNAKECLDTPQIGKENAIFRGHMALFPTKFASHH